MWKYKNEEELKNIKQRKKNAYKEISRPCILAMFLFLIVAKVIKIGFPTAAVPEFHPITWREFLEYGLLRAFLLELFIFFVSYLGQIISKRRIFSGTEAMIYLQCEKLKNVDKIYQCDCGVEFVPLDELEWVTEEKTSSKNADL